MNGEENIVSAETIESLKKENNELKAQVQILKENQEKVKRGMQSFLKKADEVQDVAKNTFNQNILRLKVYELKLISYYNKLVQKYPIDDDLSNLSDFIGELKKVINKDFFERENFELFASSKQLTATQVVSPEMLTPNESGFDFFEAMHPDKDLAQLCMELGLMQEEE